MQTDVAKFRLRVEELALKKAAARGYRLSQKEIAEKSKVPVTTLSRITNRVTRRIDADTVARLMDYFECGIGDLIEVVPLAKESE